MSSCAAVSPVSVDVSSESNVWTYRGDESLKLALIDVIADHQNFVDRAETILWQNNVNSLKVFSLSFTGWHDVDLGFLLPSITVDLEKRRNTLQSLRDQQTQSLVKEEAMLIRQPNLSEKQFHQLMGILKCSTDKKKELKLIRQLPSCSPNGAVVVCCFHRYILLWIRGY